MTMESEPMGLFMYAIRSSITKERYLHRLGNFFDYMELQGSQNEQAKALMEQIRQNGQTWITAKLMTYLQYHKERSERGEISEATIRNYKPIKHPFCFPIVLKTPHQNQNLLHHLS